MSKKVNHTGATPNFEGMTKVDTLQKFIKFENEGDFVKGTFLGTKKTTSKEYKGEQTCWIMELEETSCKDYSGNELTEGEKILVPEKATMETMRLEIEEGQVIAIVFEGEKKTKDGKRKFKDFSLYV